MRGNRSVVGGVTGAALVGLAVIVGLATVRAGGASSGDVPLAGRCILCNASGASVVPHICNSCNTRHGNRCILCNSSGANVVPRICNSCNTRHGNRCILCNSSGASVVPHICNSCNTKH